MYTQVPNRHKLPFSIVKRYTDTESDNWAASWQNQQNGMCAQRRLRSACASAQSDQSLRCPQEESLGPWLPNECPVWVFAVCSMGRCPGWSESSLGAHAILLILSWGGSNAGFNGQYAVNSYDLVHFKTMAALIIQFSCNRSNGIK